VCDAPFFKGKDVALVGDMKEIAEEIDSLARFAANLYVIPKKVTDPDILGSYPHVTMMSGYRVVEILGSNTVEGLRVTDPENTEQILQVSGVFVFLHGSSPIVDFLYNAVDITEEGCIQVDTHMATSVDGVYAAGDVTCTKIRQVIIAAAEGCTAALSADTYINRRKNVRPQWS
jgi:thioredoxin reductase (NADPH)